MTHKVTITVDNKYQAYRVLAVLGEAEEEGTLAFPFNAKVEDEDGHENMDTEEQLGGDPNEGARLNGDYR